MYRHLGPASTFPVLVRAAGVRATACGFCGVGDGSLGFVCAGQALRERVDFRCHTLLDMLATDLLGACLGVSVLI